MFHEMPLKLYFMKCPERKVSQCIVAFKENGYQESIISKIFKRITNNHSLPQSQQLMPATYIQEEEIRMSINLPNVECASEKLQCIFRSHKIRSTFYSENTLHKILCKPTK